MVSVEDAIKDLQNCDLIKDDRLTDFQIKLEERDPSAVTTSGELIIMLEDLQRFLQLEKMLGIPLDKLAELCKEFIPDECKHPMAAIMLTNEDVDKWHEYKNLEEQGLLLKLPCKVGDTVYQIHTLPESKRKILVQVEADEFFIALCILQKRFGKTVFLTKEEAEQALERMKNTKI